MHTLLDSPQLQPLRFHLDWTRYPASISDHEGKNWMCAKHFPALTNKSGGNWWKVIKDEPYSNVCVSDKKKKKTICRFWQIRIMKTPSALAASSSCHTVLTARQDLKLKETSPLIFSRESCHQYKEWVPLFAAVCVYDVCIQFDWAMDLRIRLTFLTKCVKLVGH